MMNKVVNSLDALFMMLSSNLKENFKDYCELETAQNLITLVAEDGSLVTIVSVEGIKSLTSSGTFIDKIVLPLQTSFSTYLEKTGHNLQFFFSFDPSKTKEVLKTMIEPNRLAAKTLEFDLEQMFLEKLDVLPQWTSYEECYLALWSDSSLLNKSEKKEAKKKTKLIHKDIIVPTKDAQDPYAANPLLLDRHNTFVSSTIEELKKREIICNVLDVNSAVRAIKSSVDTDFTSSHWEPVIPGSKIRPNMRRQYTAANQWDIMWPKLNDQICNRNAQIISDKFLKIGSKVYAPMYIDILPKDLREFSELFNSLARKNLPWRISFNIGGDGLASLTMKKLFSSILSFTSNENSLISESIKELEFHQDSFKQAIVKLQISLCTWVDEHNIDDLPRRLSELSSAVQNWGSTLVSDITGDPVAGFMSSALSVSKKSIATTAGASLDETIYMLPLKRPSSPWKTGGVIFRSPDGKLMPYQPGSNLQDTWLSLIFAGPGSGKSVLMNALNLALATKEGNTVLPYIGIIDIGPSSAGLISLLKDALPMHKKHLVTHHRIRMTPEYSINPLDTQLGCRFPTAEESAFIVNFLTLVVTDPTQQDPPTGMVGLITSIVRELYYYYSDTQNPKKYQYGILPEVDEILNKIPFEINHYTTWWNVVDVLFENNYFKEASSAQRFAVPILSDTTEIAQSDKIKMVYKNPETETTENVIQAFNRGVSEAMEIYKILARPTVFDIGESRITSIDLDEVAKGGGDVADRQTAIMYMLARYVLAKNYKLIPETVQEMPYSSQYECPSYIPVSKYKDYHLARVLEMKDNVKRLCLDEFHRTSKSKLVREQILVDIREGRKWNLDILLASQSLEDFDPRMREFTTSVFIMNGGNDETIAKITEVFGCSDPAESIVLKNGAVHGPRKGGGTFLAKFYTKMGPYTQLLSFTLGPIELWAFSTTVEEVAIRDRMYKAIGPVEARKILATIYPAPSDAREEVAKIKNSVNINFDSERNVYDYMVKHIIDKYNTYYRR